MHHAITSLTDGSPIQFVVNASGEVYIDFANTLLYVTAQLAAADDTNRAADAAIGPVNLFLHSMFSQVDILLNGTLITSSTNTYASDGHIFFVEGQKIWGAEGRGPQKCAI